MTTSALNYAAFFTLYVICFAYLFRSNSGIVALGTLTVVHSACTLFIGNEMSDMLVIKPNQQVKPNQPIILLAMLAIILTVGMNLAALIIILLMVTKLQKKYNDKLGTPFNLPRDEEKRFGDYKTYLLVTFIMSCILLYLIKVKSDVFNVNISESIFPVLIIAAISFTIIGLSITQVVIASELAKLKDRSII